MYNNEIFLYFSISNFNCSIKKDKNSEISIDSIITNI